MEKLTEASDRKKRRRMLKEKGLYLQKEEAHSLSAVTGGVTTYKFPLLLVEDHVTALKRHVGWPFTSSSRLG